MLHWLHMEQHDIRCPVRSVVRIRYPLFSLRRCVFPPAIGKRDPVVVARTMSIVVRRSGDRSVIDQLGTGLEAIQLSPHHAGLAGLECQRLLSPSRFSAMLLSPDLSVRCYR